MAPPKLRLRDPTEEEVINELKKAACGKLPEKRLLVEHLIENKTEIVSEMGLIDQQLAGMIKQAIPTMDELNKFANKKAAFIAPIIFKASTVFNMFRGMRKHKTTRSAYTNKHYKTTIEFLSPVANLREKATGMAKAKQKEDCAKVWVKLSHQEMNRKFLEGGGEVPELVGLRCCIGCGHCLIDEPAEQNKAAAKRNLEKMKEHQLKKDEFEAQKKQGLATGRSPPPPKPDSVYLQCHCHQMYCLRGGGGTCPECIRNPPKYDSSGRCPCPMCNCNCDVAYQVACCVVCCLCLWGGCVVVIGIIIVVIVSPKFL